LETGLFISQLLLICGTVGLLTFAVLSAVYRFMFPASLLSIFSFLAAVFLTAYIAIPLYFGMPVSTAFARHWWGYGFEISIVFASLAAYLTARRPRRNYAINGASP
jgi:hypothetical protein